MFVNFNKKYLYLFSLAFLLSFLSLISSAYAWKCPVPGMPESTCKHLYPNGVPPSYDEQNEGFGDFITNINSASSTDAKIKTTLGFINSQLDWIIRIVLAFCTITSLIVLIANIVKAAASQSLPFFRHLAFHSLFKSFIFTLLISGSHFFYYLVLYFLGK